MKRQSLPHPEELTMNQHLLGASRIHYGKGQKGRYRVGAEDESAPSQTQIQDQNPGQCRTCEEARYEGRQ